THGITDLFSLPPGTEMVHFPGLALRSLCIQLRVTSKKLAGFPHSEISGSRDVCSSPELIAACHVLHRLHAPRHPPCALSSLTIKFAHHKNSASTTGLHFTPSSSEIQKIYFFGNFAYSIVKEHYFKTVSKSRSPFIPHQGETVTILGARPRCQLLRQSTSTKPVASLCLVEVRGFEPLTP